MKILVHCIDLMKARCLDMNVNAEIPPDRAANPTICDSRPSIAPAISAAPRGSQSAHLDRIREYFIDMNDIDRGISSPPKYYGLQSLDCEQREH